jgi:histidinol-phosphate aminotransferase
MPAMSIPPQSPVRLIREDIRGMRPYTPGEQILGCTKLNTNECAWPPSPRVREVLRAVADDRLRLYPDPLAGAVREAAARRFGGRPEQILVGNGSDDCLTILYRACCAAGGTVAAPWPTYGLYDTLAGIQGLTIEHHAMALEGEAAWSLPESLFGSRARLVLIANPNNPSSTLIPPDQLSALADSLPDGLLVVDEAYVDFARCDGGASMLPRLERHPNLVVLRTFSKSLSLAGARLGLLWAHPELVLQFQKVKDSYNVNALSQAVAVAALDDADHHQALLAQTIAARADLEARLAPFGWRWPPAQGNFLLCTVGAAAPRILDGLRQRGLLVRRWDTPELHDKLRITVGQPAQHEALVAAVQDILG